MIAKVKFELAHVQHVSDSINLQSHLNNEELESVIIDFEGQLLLISQSVNGAD